MTTSPDHPWSPIDFLDYPPGQLKQSAWDYREKPHAARCPAHRGGPSQPCRNCRQVRLHAQDLQDEARGTASEERSRKRHEIAACRLCDASGMAGFPLPDGKPAAARCRHSEEWLAEVVHEATEMFHARNREEAERKRRAGPSPERQALLAQLRSRNTRRHKPV